MTNLLKTVLFSSLLGFCSSVSFAQLPPPSQAQTTTSFSLEEREEIEQIIKEYLRSHPELLFDMVKELQTGKSERNRISDHVFYQSKEDLYRSPMSPVLGKLDAPITVVHFIDYNCSFCKKMYQIVDHLPIGDDTVRVVYKEFPILAPTSEIAARAALAAAYQGRYLSMHTNLMRMRAPLSQKDVFDAAHSLGLDLEQLKKDMADPRIDEELERTKKLAKDLEISQTPITIVQQSIYRGLLTKGRLQDYVNEAKTNYRLQTGKSLFELPDLPAMGEQK